MSSVRILSQKFHIEEGVREDHLVWVEDRAEIKTKMGPDMVSAGSKPIASLSVRLNGDGLPIEVCWNVMSQSDKFRFRFDASKIFPSAPQQSKVVSGQLDLAIFDFPPSSFSSRFVTSDDLNFGVQVGPSASSGTIPREEVEKWGSAQVLVKAHIALTKDLEVAQLQFCVIPHDEETTKSLPGFSKDTLLYPSVLASACQLGLGPVSVHNNGIPLRLFLWSTEHERPVPDLNSIRQAIRKMMASPHMALSRSRQQFDSDTRDDKVTPSMTPIPQEFAWPNLVIAADIPEDEDDFQEGRNMQNQGGGNKNK